MSKDDAQREQGPSSTGGPGMEPAAKRMKILLVNYEYPPLGGGGGVALDAIARQLAERHTVHVLTSMASGLPCEEKIDGLDLTVFRSKTLLRNSKSVASMPSMFAFYPMGSMLGRKLAKEHGYDVMNTWFAIPTGPTGTHIAKKAKIPHLLTIIGGDIYDPSKWYSPHRNRLLGSVVRRVLRRADAHSAISEDIARRAREHYGFERPVEVISLGISEPQYQPKTRAELGMEEGRIYLSTCGRHVRRKDYPTLLSAHAKLDRDDVSLVLIGDGPERANLESFARELGTEDRVLFPGFVEEERKFQLLHASDAFVLTSLHEGFGLVYLEGMHCGLPVVASDKGGQEDFLVDGETGFMVPSEDVEALTGALGRLLEDAALRERMAEHNRRLVAEYYVSRTAERYEELLARTCGFDLCSAPAPTR